MPSDLIVNVRQIANYPAPQTVYASDQVLIQQGGLGGPYAAASTEQLVTDALAQAGPLGVGTYPPPGDETQIFTNNFITAPEGGILFNLYFNGTTAAVWQAGFCGGMALDAGTGILEWELGSGQPNTQATLAGAMSLDQAGNLYLPRGTLTVARDPAGYFDVATMGWVSNNTVQSFNARKGQVTLNASDVYSALNLCDPIATQPWVINAINQSIQNLLWTCSFVNTWNGRSGSVYLMLSDITTVFFQPGQQPISPTPPTGSSDNSIATTAFVSAALSGSGIPLNVKDFGAVGDGVTDDTQAVQAALTAAANAGGGTVNVGSLICLTGNISVPGGVTLRGNWDHPGLRLNYPTTGDTQYLHLYDMPSQIILQPNATISLIGDAAAVQGLIITRQGLSFPATSSAGLATLLGQFNGVAIASDYRETCLRNLLLIGHAQGANIGLNAASDRYMIEYVFGDCTNGIHANGSYDLSRMNFCHFWPYLSFNVPGATLAQYSRSGTAYLLTATDWLQMLNCFAYSYATNFHLIDCSAATLVACQSDANTAGSIYGFYIEGKSDPVSLQGCGGNNSEWMLYIGATVPINPGQTPTAVRSFGCRFAPSTGTQSSGTGVEVLNGWYGSFGDTFESGARGIVGDSGTSGCIIGSLFRNEITTAFGFADVATAANWDVISPSYGSGTAAPEPSTINHGLQVYQSLLVQNGGAFWINQNGQGPDQNLWRFIALGGGTGTLEFEAVNDAVSATTPWLTLTRTGYVPQHLTLTAPTISLAGQTILEGNTYLAPGANLLLQQTGQGTDQNDWGFSVAGGGTGALNGVAWNDSFSAFTQWLDVTRIGYVPQQIVLTAPSITLAGAVTGTSSIVASDGVQGAFIQTGSGGPTWTSGAGVPGPAQPQPPGSLFSNTAGSVGSHLYVSAGGGTWNAVAGV